MGFCLQDNPNSSCYLLKNHPSPSRWNELENSEFLESFWQAGRPQIVTDCSSELSEFLSHIVALLWLIIILDASAKFALIEEHLVFFPSNKTALLNPKGHVVEKGNLAWMPKAIQQCYWKYTLLRLSTSLLQLRFSLKALNYLVRKCILWPGLTLISNNSHVDHYWAGTE